MPSALSLSTLNLNRADVFVLLTLLRPLSAGYDGRMRWPIAIQIKNATIATPSSARII